ncbi:Myotubularin-related protein 4, partial [Eschrichtius robustus]|nr:Myotubularin-related protein 4 [Eschrichtius robustus]
MDDLLSACDTSSPLTRTSSDPNLNNHCQEARVGLEPWHGNPEGSETTFVESGVGGLQQTVGEMALPPSLPSSQKDYLSNKPFKSHRSSSPSYRLLNAAVPQETKGSTSDPEIKVLEETKAPAPDPPAQDELGRTLDGTEEPPEHCPEKAAVRALSKVVSSKRDGACDFPESSQDSLTGAPEQAQLDSVLGVPSRGAPAYGLGTLCNPPSTTCQIPPDPSTDFLNQDPPGSVASVSHQEQPSSVPDLIQGEEDMGKRGNNRNGQLLENPRFGKVPLELAQKPISQSQIMPPLYLDDDGLPFPTDVIQHRLRQIEAGYKQEVEQLRRQVRELQMRLDIRHCCAPPAEPPMDYEDDFTCLKESDGSDTEDFGSDHSEDCLSEASWEPVDKKETEVTRWVPDHMASHCYNCDCEFWLAKRRHHCRNCGNVFCAGCCHLKLPIPDQQLYDPVLVCNSCYEHIQVSRARELMSQHLKKPIATASS